MKLQTIIGQLVLLSAQVERQNMTAILDFENSVRNHALRYLKTHGGRMRVWDLERGLNAQTLGARLWTRVYQGLLKDGRIRETGVGVKSDPKIVQFVGGSDGNEEATADNNAAAV